MSEASRARQNMCHLEIDPNVVTIKPVTPKQRVVHDLLILKSASLADLVRSTGLTDTQVLSEIKAIRSQYDIKGNKRIGYRLSSDPEIRLALCQLDESLSGARVVRK